MRLDLKGEKKNLRCVLHVNNPWKPNRTVITWMMQYQRNFTSTQQSLQLICSSEVRFLLSLVPLSFPLSSPRPHTHTHDEQDRTAADDIFSLTAALNVKGATWQKNTSTGSFAVPARRCRRSNWDRAGICKLQTDLNTSCAPLALSQNKETRLASIQHS